MMRSCRETWPVTTALTLLSLFIAKGEGQTMLMTCHYFSSPQILEAVPSARIIEIPMKPGSYLPNQHCEWRILSSDPDRVVKVFVHKCNIEGPDFQGQCSRDYIEFYQVSNQDFKYIDRICSRKDEGQIYESSSMEMRIQFVSNLNFEFTGFRLSYLTVPQKPKESEDDFTLGLAVGIPVGVLSLCIVICAVICIWQRWRSKHAPPRRSAPADRRRPATTHEHYNVPDQSVEIQTPSSQLQYPYDETVSQGNLPHEPLRVALPESPSTARYEGSEVRSSTPPPSYDYLVRHEGLLGGRELYGQSMHPPDYETVVKENLEQRPGVQDSEI